MAFLGRYLFLGVRAMSCNFLLFYSGVAVFMICSGVEAFMFFAAHECTVGSFTTVGDLAVSPQFHGQLSKTPDWHFKITQPARIAFQAATDH